MHVVLLSPYLVNHLANLTGAEVSFANTDRATRRANRGVPLEHRRPPGAVVAVSWAADGFVADPEDARLALGENPRFTVDTI